MVLLVDDRGVRGIAGHLVDARHRVLAVEELLLAVLTDPCVVHPPRLPSVVRREDTRRRDPDQHPLDVLRIRKDRMEAEPSAARGPLVATLPVVQRVHGGPCDALVRAAEQARGLGARVQSAVHALLELPDPRHRETGLLREPGALLAEVPAAAEVRGPRDHHPPVLARDPCEQSLALHWVEDRVSNLDALEVRTPLLPPLSIIGMENEQSLPRPHRHDRITFLRVRHVNHPPRRAEFAPYPRPSAGRPPAEDGQRGPRSRTQGRTSASAPGRRGAGTRGPRVAR